MTVPDKSDASLVTDRGTQLAINVVELVRALDLGTCILNRSVLFIRAAKIHGCIRSSTFIFAFDVLNTCTFVEN